jgi:chromosome partitioning protein
MALVVVVSGKGGSGKTTTAMNVGGAIHEMRQLAKRNGADDPSLDIVLVDADTGASLTESFKFVPDGSQAYDLFTGAGIDELTVETREGLRIVPGTPKIGALTTADLDKTIAHLRAITRERHLLIDTHNGLDLCCTKAALRAADVVIVPLQPEPKSWKRSLTDIIVGLQTYKIEPALFCVATMVVANTRLAQHELDQVAKSGVTLATQVPRSISAQEGDTVGLTAIAHAPKSAVAEAYRGLARSIVATLNRERLVELSSGRSLPPDVVLSSTA